MDNNKLTTEEANELLEEAEEASLQRDVAINATARASVNEAAAKEVARAQGVAARSAEAQTAEMNTLRHVANARADQEAQSAETSRFGFYLLLSIVLAVLVVVVMWLATRTPETNVSNPSGSIQQSEQAPLPSVVPPPTVVIPGPQGPQGPAGTPASQGATGPSGTPGPSGPTGASGAAGPAGPTGASGTSSAPDSTTPTSGQ